MKRISFDLRFVSKAGNDLIRGKIHTIRQNYDYWKRFEGKEVALFVWDGKPYQKGSKQKVFCVKRIVSVQTLYLTKHTGLSMSFASDDKRGASIWRHDGFSSPDKFFDWFKDYPPGKMAILHFTDYRY